MGQNAWGLNSRHGLGFAFAASWNKQSDMYVKRSIPISCGFIIIVSSDIPASSVIRLIVSIGRYLLQAVSTHAIFTCQDLNIPNSDTTAGKGNQPRLPREAAVERQEPSIQHQYRGSMRADQV